MTPALEKYVAAGQDPGLALDSLGNSLAMFNAVLVIGPQALTVSLPGEDGEPRELGFYRLVAERLLARFDLPLDGLDAAAPSWDLHRACAQARSARGLSVKRLKPTVA